MRVFDLNPLVDVNTIAQKAFSMNNTLVTVKVKKRRDLLSTHGARCNN